MKEIYIDMLVERIGFIHQKSTDLGGSYNASKGWKGPGYRADDGTTIAVYADNGISRMFNKSIHYADISGIIRNSSIAKFQGKNMTLQIHARELYPEWKNITDKRIGEFDRRLEMLYLNGKNISIQTDNNSIKLLDNKSILYIAKFDEINGI